CALTNHDHLLIVGVCSIFYLLGLHQHLTGVAAVLNSVIACSIPANFTVYGHQSVELDFDAQHVAENLRQPEAAANWSRSFPPCDIRYSEYTPCEDRDRSLRFDREHHCPERNELLKGRIPRRMATSCRSSGRRAGIGPGSLTSPSEAHRQEGRPELDPGTGPAIPVASWGAYLLSRGILTMSFAPRDTHEAQVQFALERGVSAMVGVMASRKLPYPSRAFDMAHCSRCLIPWHKYGEAFKADTELWKKRLSYYKTVINQLEQKGRYRNMLVMNAHLGGFAAALVEDPVWVMYVVPVEAKLNTLGVVIYERGLIGTYMSWDDIDVIVMTKPIVDALQWDSQIIDHEDGPMVREKLLVTRKLYWTFPDVRRRSVLPLNQARNQEEEMKRQDHEEGTEGCNAMVYEVDLFICPLQCAKIKKEKKVRSYKGYY
ncbi:putative methyltransferase, partial [Nymphaea thermarum]